MSWSATVLLSVDILDDEALIDAFNRWLRTRAPRRQLPNTFGVGFLRPLHEGSQAWGGWGLPEARIWGGITNDADVEAIVDRFATMSWRHPECAQLMIQDQGQPIFRVWMIVDGRPRELRASLDAADDVIDLRRAQRPQPGDGTTATPTTGL